MSSQVTCTSESEVLVGNLAADTSHIHPESNIFEVKRLIGKIYDDEGVQDDIKRLPYAVINEYGMLKINAKDQEDMWNKIFFPEYIYDEILKDVLRLAKNHLNADVSDAVIAVPAYFGSDQRESTKDSAHRAGFKNVHLINEPTAAALAYQHENKVRLKRNLLVYDFGGGTFDVSIVCAKGSKFDVLAVDGDCHLGGTDIDSNLTKYVINDILKQYYVEITSKQVMARIKSVCKKAKERLSRRNTTVISLNRVVPQVPEYELTLSRYTFEDINEDTVNKTLQVVKQCLKTAEVDKDEIEVVILCGGSTRMPLVTKMLENYFGPNKLSNSLNVDHLVAQGAAIHAHNIFGDNPEISFNDVLSLSLGTDIEDNEMSFIIKRNTRLPCKQSKRYCTVTDNQSEMNIDIYQGENQLATKNTHLGNFTIDIETMGPARKVVVEITFSIDNEGILKVDAQEYKTDNKRSLRIDTTKKR